MRKPKGFDEGDIVLLEQQSEEMVQTVWTDQDFSILRITQQWKDGDEETVYLTYRETEEIAGVVRGRNSIQHHEDYLDAMERHDEATMRGEHV